VPALSFKKEFVDAVKNGTKTQTIRATRKRPIKVGDTLYLYTGMRTKNCKKLKEVICKSVQDIFINEAGITLSDDEFPLRYYVSERLALDDGFNSFTELFCFIESNHVIPFKGQLIKW
jgi:ASC-1-like (ASCH) protein